MTKQESLKQLTDIPVVFASQQGIVTYINAKFAEVFQWQANEIIGKPLTVIIPPKLHDAHNLGLSRFIFTGQPTLIGKPLALPAVKKDGQEFNAEHTIYAEKIDDEWVLCATIKELASK